MMWLISYLLRLMFIAYAIIIDVIILKRYNKIIIHMCSTSSQVYSDRADGFQIIEGRFP